MTEEQQGALDYLKWIELQVSHLGSIRPFMFDVIRKDINKPAVPEAVREALRVAHEAISSLPADALGEGKEWNNSDIFRWPIRTIRNEVLDTINKGMRAIAEQGDRYKPNVFDLQPDLVRLQEGEISTGKMRDIIREWMTEPDSGEGDD